MVLSRISNSKDELRRFCLTASFGPGKLSTPWFILSIIERIFPPLRTISKPTTRASVPRYQTTGLKPPENVLIAAVPKQKPRHFEASHRNCQHPQISTSTLSLIDTNKPTAQEQRYKWRWLPPFGHPIYASPSSPSSGSPSGGPARPFTLLKIFSWISWQ